MPTINECIRQSVRITHASETIPVERTVAEELRGMSRRDAAVECIGGSLSGFGDVHIAVLEPDRFAMHAQWDPGDGMTALFRLAYGRIEFLVTRESLLYFLFRQVLDRFGDTDMEAVPNPFYLRPVFASIRPVYDSMLTQHNRTARGFDADEHVRNLARIGCTHVEVNGLASPLPLETGPPGEVLHRFYTYCPALDQFAFSALNAGIYPAAWLEANMRRLQDNASRARAYGLAGGLLCFEPRSVPDTLFERYPMLRGARVDHPLRSFRPRYNLSVTHPLVEAHYAEMLTKVLRAAPGIDCMTIWSNDSGAGFEYTSSLYVGRNGGGYVIREWKDQAEIASAAAGSMLRFLRVLRDAGRAVQPGFRVLLRLEPFWAEYQRLWDGLEDGIGVEVSSLLSSGWGLRYAAPVVPETPEIHGTALHNRFHPDERAFTDDLRAKNSFAEFYFSPEMLWNHEPVLGIPFPRLVHEKLLDFHANGAGALCYYGAPAPGMLCPFNINQEVVRAFQAGSPPDLESLLATQAARWVCAENIGHLTSLWLACDAAMRSFPIPIWIYAAWSVWYRLWIRPIVPDIEAIPETEREYYERYLLATPHNRNRIDLRYDVGFDLMTPDRARHFLGIMDERFLPLLRGVVDTCCERADAMHDSASGRCFGDLSMRLRAWYCLMRTQRNVLAWITGVHGYLESESRDVRAECRRLLHDMVVDEIENTRDLFELWTSTGGNWMILSDLEETTFMYGRNFGAQLQEKIRLMEGRENDEPRVDTDFQWRVPGSPSFPLPQKEP